MPRPSKHGPVRAVRGASSSGSANDLRVGDGPAEQLVEARGGRGLLGRVGGQDGAGDRAAEQPRDGVRRREQRRERRELAVVRERPEDGVELRVVGDGAQRARRSRRLGERALVDARAAPVAERPARDEPRRAVDLDLVDDAQALADPVLHPPALVAVDPGRAVAAEQAREAVGHRLGVEQHVAARDARVGGEQRRADGGGPHRSPSRPRSCRGPRPSRPTPDRRRRRRRGRAPARRRRGASTRPSRGSAAGRGRAGSRLATSRSCRRSARP